MYYDILKTFSEVTLTISLTFLHTLTTVFKKPIINR